MSFFLDTNILVYASIEDRRTDAAVRLLCSPYHISIQSLNEYINVMRRKLKRDWIDIEDAIADFLESGTQVHAISASTQMKALALAKRHEFRIYDAQIVASALEANCTTLWSEDMHDGMIIEERLTIRNPFA